MRKLLSRAVHFSLRSGQHVTCADCISLRWISQTDFPAPWKTEPKLILKTRYKQLGWATDGSTVCSGGLDIKVFTVERVS